MSTRRDIVARHDRLEQAARIDSRALLGDLEDNDDMEQALLSEKACGDEVSTWRAATGVPPSTPGRTALLTERRRVEELIEASYRAHLNRTGTRQERRALTAEVLRAIGSSTTAPARVSRLPERPTSEHRKAA